MAQMTVQTGPGCREACAIERVEDITVNADVRPNGHGSGAFSVAGCRVDPSRNSVTTNDVEAQIEPKIMDVLVTLARHPGEVLSRDVIIQTVWGRSFGADESLTRAISRLRKLLNDPSASTSVIETVAKRGYRLVAPVISIDQAGVPGETRADPKRWPWLIIGLALISVISGVWWFAVRPPAAPADGITVAVERFETIGQPAGDALSRAMPELIAAALARTPLLRISSAPSGAAPTAFAVEGSVQRLQDARRVSVRIADRSNGETLWTGAFDTSTSDSAAAQDRIVRAIAGQLHNRLLIAEKQAIRKRPMLDLKPWELTLLATWVPGSDEVFLAPHGREAFWLQRRALSIDPRYAPAHASLASALAYRALFDRDEMEPALAEAKQHADQAQAIMPYDAGVLYELATYHRLTGDRSGTIALLQRVEALQPDHPLAAIDRIFVNGQCTDHAAISVAQLRARLDHAAPDDPVRWVILSHIADLQLGDGDIAAAATSAAASRAIVRSTWSGITLAAALASAGQDRAAGEVARETRLEWPRLDWRAFADRHGALWCMGGNARAATAAFARVGGVDL